MLLKPLGPQLPRVRHLAGATILAGGKVVPILNAHDLIRAALAGAATPPLQKKPAAPSPKKVLVAEDSITARTLLRNILQSAGYAVTVAVDGIDAWTKLKTNAFDLVISDVDMPRMSGFDLTARIRGDPELAELPVILVTALASREDQERGIDAGANSYIVKSSFDQGHLLEAVTRLI